MRRITTALLLLSAVGIGIACSAYTGDGEDVRPPAVAGQFYPSDPGHLKAAIQSYIKDAIAPSTGRPIALIVPHAGYIFSGQIGADAYRQAAGQQYDVVVILGTNHTTAGFSGISVFTGRAFRTPLGDAPVDEKIAASLLAQDSHCGKDQAPQAREHSVEVQVPFVQVLFPQAKIVPIVIGDPDLTMCTHFGQVLAKVLKDRKALIVASSDLSHYPAYSDAAGVDHQTLTAIAGLDPKAFETKTRSLMGTRVPSLVTCACGAGPIMAAMAAAKALGAGHGVVVSYANSGDTSIGEPDRVVGYGGVVLAPGTPGPSDLKALEKRPAASSFTPLQDQDKKVLLKLARETILRFLTTDTLPLVRGMTPRMEFPQGAFVTLKKHGELRGCIGRIPPEVPLGRTVGSMAVQAAFNDPRFEPVKLSEVSALEIEISALTPIKEVARVEDIVIGRDGTIIRKDGRSAVFLPQVAPENHWSREQMLDNLCLKAGLPAGSWKQGTQFYTFQAEVFSESQFRSGGQ